MMAAPLRSASSALRAMLVETVLAASCPACSGSLSDHTAGVCASCWNDLEGPGAGAVAWHERLSGRPLASVTASGPYQGRLRRIIRCMKFSDLPGLAGPLGRILASRLLAAGVEVDLIVPVPLHWRRRWRRGYNQADLLALAVANDLRLPVAPRRLRRRRATASQTGRSRRGRVANVRGAFVTGRSGFGGSRILLVDDVMTTGATLAECARVLRAAGASEVHAAASARTYSRIAS